MLKISNFYLSIVLFAMVSICSFAKDKYPKLPTLSAEQRQCKIAPFESKGKYGFILIEYSKGKQKEKKIVKPVFEKTCDFEEGNLSRIKYNGRWGVVDKSMAYVLPPEYEDVKILSSNYIAASKNEKYGVLNISGEETLPFEYVRIEKVDSKKKFYLVYQVNKVGGINATTGKVIPCEYDDITTYNDGARVFCICKQSNFWGIRDENGTIISPCLYDSIKPEKRSNITSFICKTSNHYGVLDGAGKIIVPVLYDEVQIVEKSKESSALLYKCILSNTTTLYCNNKVIECDSIAFIKDKLIGTKSHKKGLFSNSLDTIVPINYDEIIVKSNYISVRNNGKYGAYSLSGEKLIDATSAHEINLKRNEWIQYYDEEMYTAYLVSANKKYSAHEQQDYLSSLLPVQYGDYYSSSIGLTQCSKNRCAESEEFGDVCDLETTRLEDDIKIILSSLAPCSVKAKAIFDFMKVSKGGANWCFRGDGTLYYKQALDSVFPNIKINALGSVGFKQPDSSAESRYEVTDSQGNTYTHKILRKAESKRWHQHAMIYQKSTDDDIYIAIMKGESNLSEIKYYQFVDQIKKEANIPQYHIWETHSFYKMTDHQYVFFAVFKEVVGSHTLVYDKPTYVNIAGHPMMVNPGRKKELEVDIHDYMVICDEQFNIKKVVPVPEDHQINFFEDNSFCFIPDPGSPNTNDVLFYNSDGTLKFTYCPPDGRVFSNVVKYNNDFYMGGLTYTHGYVDYANPMLVRFDATTGRHLDTKYEKRKSAYIENIYIKGNVLYILQNGEGAFKRKTSDEYYGWSKSSKPCINLDETSSETKWISTQDFQWGGRNVSKISFGPNANVASKWKDFFIIVPTSEASKIELYPSNDNSNRVFVKCSEKYAVATIEEGLITPFQFRTLSAAKEYQLPSTSKSVNIQTRRIKPQISERQAEQRKYLPILASLLEHPLGVQDLRWTDSKRKIENYFADKYPDFTPCRLSCTSNIADNIKDAPCYYTKIEKFETRWDGDEIFVTYYFRGNMLLAKKIREDLMAYGFNEMSDFVKGDCSDFHDVKIHGVQYKHVSLLSSPSGCFYIHACISKKKTDYRIPKEQKIQLPIQENHYVASAQEPSKTQHDDSRERSLGNITILGSLLQHPLGISDLRWSDPKAQQKTYLLSKYPNIEIRDEYTLTLRSREGINDVPVYYNSMREFRYNLDFKGSITMSYKISGDSDIAEKIRKDLIAYGFKMPEFSNAEVPSSTQYNCGVIQGVKYGWMSVTCYTTGIEIRFKVEK